MKCKICGHRTNTINAMRVHYVQKHPGAMKRKTKKARVSDLETKIDSLIDLLKKVK